MRSISIELRFKIDKHRTTRGESLVGNRLLKFCVAFVDLGVECSGVKFLSGHSKFVDEREVKTAKAFDGGVASAFREGRGAATDHGNGHRAEERVSDNQIGRKYVHKARIVRLSILRQLASLCQD